jgi:hypothetical protein
MRIWHVAPHIMADARPRHEAVSAQKIISIQWRLSPDYFDSIHCELPSGEQDLDGPALPGGVPSEGGMMTNDTCNPADAGRMEICAFLNAAAAGCCRRMFAGANTNNYIIDESIGQPTI